MQTVISCGTSVLYLRPKIIDLGTDLLEQRDRIDPLALLDALGNHSQRKEFERRLTIAQRWVSTVLVFNCDPVESLVLGQRVPERDAQALKLPRFVGPHPSGCQDGLDE